MKGVAGTKYKFKKCLKDKGQMAPKQISHP